MDPALHRIRIQTLRLTRYSQKIKEKIWNQDLIGNLPDIAEAHEIARRLYPQVAARLKGQNV